MPKTKEEEKRVKCPQCKETGKVKIAAMAKPLDPAKSDLFETCPLCEGSGSINGENLARVAEERDKGLLILAFLRSVAQMAEETKKKLFAPSPKIEVELSEEEAEKIWKEFAKNYNLAKPFGEILEIVSSYIHRI